MISGAASTSSSSSSAASGVGVVDNPEEIDPGIRSPTVPFKKQQASSPTSEEPPALTKHEPVEVGNITPMGICDPTGRFERGSELLGRGASKEVYQAFDHEEGVEVAWNQLKVDNLTESTAAKILSEIQILQSLTCDNIIRFYHSWISKNAAGYFEVFFITELMTSGTLKNYLQKAKGPIRLKVVKGWCRQILKALYYLHTKQPPIIHRDLKCDNIFVNGNNGQAKLGDFGLAVLKNREMLTSVIGTPEFMAPELYDESYDEKVDIYAFGMCVIEMVTKDYPYSECDNAAQIFRKVTQGIKPAALAKITDDETRAFIEACVDPDPAKRPTAAELLEHQFISSVTTEETNGAASKTNTEGSNCEPSGIVSPNSATSPLPSSGGVDVAEPKSPNTENCSGTASAANSSSQPSSPLEEPKVINCLVDVTGCELPIVQLRMRILMTPSSANKEVKFPFALGNDTVLAVVHEMVREAVLPETAQDLAASAIDEALQDSRMAFENEKLAGHLAANNNNTTSSSATIEEHPNGSVRTEAVPQRNVTLSPVNGSNLNLQNPNTVQKPQTADEMAQPPSHSLQQPAPTLPPPIIDEHHPEVATLLQRQRKELELLQLFHHRELQLLMQTLQKQALMNQQVHSPPPPPAAGLMPLQQTSAAAMNTSQMIHSRPETPAVRLNGHYQTAKQPSMYVPHQQQQMLLMQPNQLSHQQQQQAPQQQTIQNQHQQQPHQHQNPMQQYFQPAIFDHSLDERQFVAQIRNLMYDATGNAAWIGGNGVTNSQNHINTNGLANNGYIPNSAAAINGNFVNPITNNGNGVSRNNSFVVDH